jgi:hypothetical protein
MARSFAIIARIEDYYQDKEDNDWLPSMRREQELIVEKTSEEPWKTS